MDDVVRVALGADFTPVRAIVWPAAAEQLYRSTCISLKLQNKSIFVNTTTSVLKLFVDKCSSCLTSAKLKHYFH